MLHCKHKNRKEIINASARGFIFSVNYYPFYCAYLSPQHKFKLHLKHSASNDNKKLPPQVHCKQTVFLKLYNHVSLANFFPIQWLLTQPSMPLCNNCTLKIKMPTSSIAFSHQPHGKKNVLPFLQTFSVCYEFIFQLNCCMHIHATINILAPILGE